jgi:hypothetical protein
VEPGGSSRLIWVCARSAAGTKPVGSRPVSMMEQTKKAPAHAVTRRWLRHHFITRM